MHWLFVYPVTTWLRLPASLGNQVLAGVISPGRDQNAKFDAWFLLKVYHFHTFVKLKTYKLNHPQ